MKKGLLTLLFTLFGFLIGCEEYEEYSKTMGCLNRAYRIGYVDDGIGVDYWQTPEETKERRKGDCEDKAFYLQDLLREKSIESEVIFGFADDRKRETIHVWVEGKREDITYVLDPCRRLMMDREKLNEHSYIPVHNNDYLKSQLKEFQERSGIKEINKHYENLG